MHEETKIDFEEVVDDHYQALYRFGYSLSGSEHDASDLVQETFTIFAKKGDSIRDASKVKTWLFTTLHRQFLRQIRKDKRLQFRTPEHLADEPLSANCEVARSLDGKAAIAALHKIAENYRAPLTLFYLRHLSYREIGEILELPVGTVMSRIARGKVELKKLLQDPNPENR